MTDSELPPPTSQDETRQSRDWHQLIEERINQLDLDNLDLPGKGKPLNLEQNPYADPGDEIAHHVLKNAGYTLPWIAGGKDIEAELEKERTSLLRAWERYRDMRDVQMCAGHQWVEGEWQAALREFRQHVEQLNRQIRDYNLQVRLPQLHKFAIRIEEELARLGIDG